MTTNLYLNSNNALSYTAGKAVFKVSWVQYLSDHQNYKVSFSFMSVVDTNLNEDDLYVLSIENPGSIFKQIAGGANSSSSSTVLGTIYSEEPHSSHARLRANASDNVPIDLCARPNEDLLEIAFRDVSGALSVKDPQFILFLRFEAI
tara:strand:+ start:127 stop:567 length:441 start_codon:yes stop_codon:yes gene_type:complete